MRKLEHHPTCQRRRRRRLGMAPPGARRRPRTVGGGFCCGSLWLWLWLGMILLLFTAAGPSSPCQAEALALWSRSSRGSREMIRGRRRRRRGTPSLEVKGPLSAFFHQHSKRSSSSRSSYLKVANGGAADDSSDEVEKDTKATGRRNLSTAPFLPPASALLGECCGTFLIVQLGTAAVMAAVYAEALVGVHPIAAVWGTAVALAIVCAGRRGGCPAHFNPAVTLAFACVRPSSGGSSRHPFRRRLLQRVIPHSLAQLLGAMLGSAVNLVLYGSTIRSFEAARGIARGSDAAAASARAFGQYFAVPVWEALCAECFGTAVLAAVIFALTHPDSEEAASSAAAAAWMVPLLIGATVGALICCLAPLTQAGFNPARDLGPRLVAWALGGWNRRVAFRGAWVYAVAPFAGAVLGAAFVDKVLYRGSGSGGSNATYGAENNKS